MRGLYLFRHEYGEEPRRRRGLFDCRPSRRFFAFHEASYPNNVESELTRRFDRIDGGGACGADIIDNHHLRAILLKALNTAAHAVTFFRLAYEKPMHRRACLRTDDGNGNDNRVSAQREAADGLRCPALRVKQIKKYTTGQFRPPGVQSSGPAIDVVITPGAGRKGEITQAEGVFRQQVEKLFACAAVHSTRTLTAFSWGNPIPHVPGVGNDPCQRKA